MLGGGGPLGPPGGGILPPLMGMPPLPRPLMLGPPIMFSPHSSPSPIPGRGGGPPGPGGPGPVMKKLMVRTDIQKREDTSVIAKSYFINWTRINYNVHCFYKDVTDSMLKSTLTSDVEAEFDPQSACWNWFWPFDPPISMLKLNLTFWPPISMLKLNLTFDPQSACWSWLWHLTSNPISHSDQNKDGHCRQTANYSLPL